MSLFQCEVCGVAENTALACQGVRGVPEKWLDWSGIEDRKGKLLCSVCAPTKFVNGNSTEFGKWHGAFSQCFLPLRAFYTNEFGNLEHKKTGDINYRKYEILKGESDADKMGN